jgi:hypothetical protein
LVAPSPLLQNVFLGQLSYSFECPSIKISP